MCIRDRIHITIDIYLDSKLSSPFFQQLSFGSLLEAALVLEDGKGCGRPDILLESRNLGDDDGIGLAGPDYNSKGFLLSFELVFELVAFVLELTKIYKFTKKYMGSTSSMIS